MRKIRKIFTFEFNLMIFFFLLDITAISEDGNNWTTKTTTGSVCFFITFLNWIVSVSQSPNSIAQSKTHKAWPTNDKNKN